LPCPLRSHIELGIDFIQINRRPELNSECHTNDAAECLCGEPHAENHTHRFCDGRHPSHANDATEPFYHVG
jgi:hypothetical protein